MSPALERHLVLHAVAVKRNGTAEEIARLSGVPASASDEWIARLAETGRIVAAGQGYALTPLARVALDGDYSRFWGALRHDGAFLNAFDNFERVNVELKALITDWQTLSVGGQRVPNDHSDSAYDAKIIERLGGLHDRCETIFDALERGSARFGIYREDLLSALEKAEDGAIEWVSDARIASYHTIWFELHEDLLRIVGRERHE